MDRVNVYIDGDNLRGGCNRAKVTLDLDLEKVIGKLVGPDRKLVRAYYYTAPLTKDADPARVSKQQKFFRYLDVVPYLETRFGVLKNRTTCCDHCGESKTVLQQKGVDLRLGVDMVAHAARGFYDTAILVSGDGDMVEAVRAVKDVGKHVELAIFEGGLSADLRKAADLYTKLTAGWFSTPDSVFRAEAAVKMLPQRSAPAS